MCFSKKNSSAQGSLEYLLLIAGGVLVSTVIIMLVFFASDTGDVFLNQQLSAYQSVSTGSFAGGNSGVCGDATCQLTETCSTCPSDCGVCTNLPVVKIIANDGVANEDVQLNDFGQVTISRTGSTALPLDVALEPDLGTAINGVDFEPVPTMITIPANVVSIDVDIIPIQDVIVEGVEDAVIQLIDPGMGGAYALSTLPGDSRAIVQIVDDDGAPPETVSLAVNDALADEENPIDIGRFTISRSGSTPAQLAQGLSVEINVIGTATAGMDYQAISSPITIPVGQTSVDVDVIPINDALDDDSETVDLSIVSNPNYIISGSGIGSVVIDDDDGGSALPVVTLTMPDGLAGESSGNTGQFLVTRNPVDSSALVVQVALTGTATQGTDYTLTALPVTIPSNQGSVPIIITPIDDSSVEGSETVIATLQGNPTYSIGNPSAQTMSIQDNDSNPPSADLCTNYNTGTTNKPGSFPTYSSIFEQSWTWRRTLNPATDIDIGAGRDSTSLVTSFSSAQCGSTIVVHDLPLAGEQDGFALNNKNCSSNPIHIYFVNPITIRGRGLGGDVIGINNTHGMVFDGMNNLTIATTQTGAQELERSMMFIGSHQPYGGFTNATKLIFKNFTVDGGYSSTTYGPKWGIFGENNTDVGFCNLDVRNIGKEHGFYFHHTAGHFEIVKTRVDTVGRTCMQVRYDYAGDPNAIYVLADNTCSNSCQGGGITANEGSGTWWIHGNTITRSVQGIVSIDSQQQGYFDHRDGELYFYNNRVHMGQDPNHKVWNNLVQCNNMGAHLTLRDGGAKFYFQNNVFLATGASNLFVWRQYVPGTSSGHYYHELVESNNNIYGFGHSSHTGNPATDRVARWEYINSTQPKFMSVNEWRTSLPSFDKPIAYDTSGQFFHGSAAIQNLINNYFSP